MSLARKATRGAAWTIVTSIGGRAIGVVGTLIMTRFLLPDVVGEVSVASILVYSGSWITTWGWGPYTVIKGRGDAAREVTWHALIAHLSLGVIGIGGMVLIGGRLGVALGAVHAADYIPGMAIAVAIRRLGFIPERTLIRALKFRAVGLSLFFGELVYTIVSLSLAVRGYGGMSVVYANIVQASVVVGITLTASGLRSWLTPTPLRWARFADMVRFGLPLAVQMVAHGASRYWDNLTISRYFGEAATGTYNMAYNLADVPAIQIGEQIALVLTPSMVELPVDQRAGAVERTSALLSLILFPLAVGLGLVAYPLIALLLPADKWQDVAPLLVILTCVSVFRPIMFVLSSYMEAQQRTNRLMGLELVKLVVLIGGIAVLSRWGLLVASGAVGISFGATSLAAVLIVSREGPSLTKLAVGFIQPAIACGVMALAVLGTARGLAAAGIDAPAALVAIEIVVGGIAYVAAAFVVCRSTALDLIRLAKQMVDRRRA